MKRVYIVSYSLSESGSGNFKNSRVFDSREKAEHFVWNNSMEDIRYRIEELNLE